MRQTSPRHPRPQPPPTPSRHSRQPVARRPPPPTAFAAHRPQRRLQFQRAPRDARDDASLGRRQGSVGDEQAVAEQLLPAEPSQPMHHEAQTIEIQRREPGCLPIAKHEEMNPHIVVERAAHLDAVAVADFEVVAPIVRTFKPFGGHRLEEQVGAGDGNRTTTAQSAFCAVTIAQSVVSRWVSATSPSPAGNSGSRSQSA
jgi:hypothetical protein